MPRYWRYVIVVPVALAAAVIFRDSTIGLVIGVFVALTIIFIVERRQRG